MAGVYKVSSVTKDGKKLLLHLEHGEAFGVIPLDKVINYGLIRSDLRGRFTHDVYGASHGIVGFWVEVIIHESGQMTVEALLSMDEFNTIRSFSKRFVSDFSAFREKHRAPSPDGVTRLYYAREHPPVEFTHRQYFISAPSGC